MYNAIFTKNESLDGINGEVYKREMTFNVLKLTLPTYIDIPSSKIP